MHMKQQIYILFDAPTWLFASVCTAAPTLSVFGTLCGGGVANGSILALCGVCVTFDLRLSTFSRSWSLIVPKFKLSQQCWHHTSCNNIQIKVDCLQKYVWYVVMSIEYEWSVYCWHWLSLFKNHNIGRAVVVIGSANHCILHCVVHDSLVCRVAVCACASCESLILRRKCARESQLIRMQQL